MAKAYWIAFYQEIKDPEKMAAYAAIGGPAITEGGGRFIVRGQAAVAYEAGKIERTTVIEFDSLEQAVASGELALAEDAQLPELKVERPKSREHGDWATNVAMQLTKKVGMPPREVWHALCDAMDVPEERRLGEDVRMEVPRSVTDSIPD